MTINYEKSAQTVIDNEIFKIHEWEGESRLTTISNEHCEDQIVIKAEDIPKLVNLLNAYYYINYLNPEKD